jgi:phosphoglycerate dehydrogenase-like enzyme
MEEVLVNLLNKRYNISTGQIVSRRRSKGFIMKNDRPIKVIIAGKYFAQIYDYLKTELPEISLEMVESKDLIKKTEGAQIIIPVIAKIDEEIFKRASSLRLVQQWGAGLDGVDISSATRYQVAVANVPTVGSGNAESVAEWYVMAALSLSRRVCEIRSQVSKSHPWGSPLGQALYGRTAGLIGFGGIGKALAIRLKPFKMRMMAIKRHPDKVAAQNLGIEWVGGVVDLPQLLKRADYLFISIPLTEETRNMISKRELALLPKGAFINPKGRIPRVYPWMNVKIRPKGVEQSSKSGKGAMGLTVGFPLLMLPKV